MIAPSPTSITGRKEARSSRSRRRRPHTLGPCSLDAPWYAAPSIRGREVNDGNNHNFRLRVRHGDVATTSGGDSERDIDAPMDASGLGQAVPVG